MLSTKLYAAYFYRMLANRALLLITKKNKTMTKFSSTHYYVQAQKEGGAIEIVCHTHDKETNEYYHKLLDRKKLKRLLKLKRKSLLM
jgi:hypothetical protein